MQKMKEQILTKISEVRICQRYIGQHYPNNLIVPSLKIAPPYDKRSDKVFKIYERNNRIWWYDEGTNQRGDLFQLLQKTYRLNYQETVTMIDFDFKLELIRNNHRLTKYEHIKLTEKTIYFLNGKKTDANHKLEDVIQKIFDFENYEINNSKNSLYQRFELLGINKEVVDDYELFELNYGKVTMPMFPFWIRSTNDNPLFAYRYCKQIKVIHPLVQGGFKRFAHIGRKGSKYLFGLKQLKHKKSNTEKLFLVANEIDVIILSVNGYDAICVCGNDGILTKEFLDGLSFAEKIIFLNNGNEEECRIAKTLKQKFDIPSVNYQNLINNETTNNFI